MIGCLLILIIGWTPVVPAQDETTKKSIKALYIPLADHYAAVVAYEKYGQQMRHADFQLEKMKSWPLLRAYFMSGEVDMAFIISPQAMDMFRERPNFRWVSLMHRDGNALAINDLLNADAKLEARRIDRKPDVRVADALGKAKRRLGRPTQSGVPHLHATHTVILYKYLKEHGKTLALGNGENQDVVAVEVPPPKSPAFIKKHNNRGIPASFEQSLPWADVVETGGYGHVAWYSKDVMPWPNGHVECIAIATDAGIRDKQEAIQEVIHYIHLAGQDIERARRQGGQAILEIAGMIRKHIPEHNTEAIVQSLRLDLNVINYRHLNVDENAKGSLRQIMDLAIEGGIIEGRIDIEAFADEAFSTDVTNEQ
ncbi:MAG: ABC transporter substrate-binding protein [Sedimenticola sp.]